MDFYNLVFFFEKFTKKCILNFLFYYNSEIDDEFTKYMHDDIFSDIMEAALLSFFF